MISLIFKGGHSSWRLLEDVASHMGCTDLHASRHDAECGVLSSPCLYGDAGFVFLALMRLHVDTHVGKKHALHVITLKWCRQLEANC